MTWIYLEWGSGYLDHRIAPLSVRILDSGFWILGFWIICLTKEYFKTKDIWIIRWKYGANMDLCVVGYDMC